MTTALTIILACGTPLDRCIDAIAHVEGGGNHDAVEKRNGVIISRGAWQISQAVWETWTWEPEVTWAKGAHNPALARVLAEVHAKHLYHQFRHNTLRDPKASDILAMWQLGVDGYGQRSWTLSRCPATTRAAVKRLHQFLRSSQPEGKRAPANVGRRAKSKNTK